MLLIAAHVFGDVRRWWNETGRHLEDGPTLGEVFESLHQVASEAEAAWSMLPNNNDGSRTYVVVEGTLIPMALHLQERGEDLAVINIRFP